MTVFRWVIGVVSAFLLLGAAGSFAVYIAFSLQHWLERARRLRHWSWLALLLWFNTEVWGRVGHTLIHWAR